METTNRVNGANVRYISLYFETKKEMKILEQKIKDHNRKQQSHIENYGFVGDMAHVLELLKEINSFLK